MSYPHDLSHKSYHVDTGKGIILYIVKCVKINIISHLFGENRRLDLVSYT